MAQYQSTFGGTGMPEFQPAAASGQTADADCYEYLVDTLDAKITQFTTELGPLASAGAQGVDSARLEAAEKIISDLDRLRVQINQMRPDDVTKRFTETIMRTYPALSLPSLEQAVTGPKTRRGRTRMKTIPMCQTCGHEVIDDVCSNPRCAISTRSIVASTHKAKPRDVVSERVVDFPNVLNILLAITELPSHFTAPIASDPIRFHAATSSRSTEAFVKGLLAEKPDITPLEICRRKLLAEYRDLTDGRHLLTSDIRSAMRCAGLCNDYIWANGVRYKLTGYRPMDYSPEDRAFFLQCYRWAIDKSYRLMGTVVTDDDARGSRKQKNQWSIQSIIRLIVNSSGRLMMGHHDFFEFLHVQGAQTEMIHADKWEQMRRTSTEKMDWS